MDNENFKNQKEMFIALLSGKLLINSRKTCYYKMDLRTGRLYYFNLQNSTCWSLCNGIPNFNKLSIHTGPIVFRGWINIYTNNSCSQTIFSTKQLAIAKADTDDLVDTVLIEWCDNG